MRPDPKRLKGCLRAQVVLAARPTEPTHFVGATRPCQPLGRAGQIVDRGLHRPRHTRVVAATKAQQHLGDRVGVAQRRPPPTLGRYSARSTQGETPVGQLVVDHGVEELFDPFVVPAGDAHVGKQAQQVRRERRVLMPRDLSDAVPLRKTSDQLAGRRVVQDRDVLGGSEPDLVRAVEQVGVHDPTSRRLRGRKDPFDHPRIWCHRRLGSSHHASTLMARSVDQRLAPRASSANQ